MSVYVAVVDDVEDISPDYLHVLVVIANWPAQRGHAWRTLLLARAIDCQAWVLGVNRVGEAQGKHHSGDSALVDPMGAVTTAVSERPTLLLGEVDAEMVGTVRERFGFLSDRRPEVYRGLGPAE